MSLTETERERERERSVEVVSIGSRARHCSGPIKRCSRQRSITDSDQYVASIVPWETTQRPTTVVYCNTPGTRSGVGDDLATVCTRCGRYILASIRHGN